MKKHLLSFLLLFVVTTSFCWAQNPILWGMTPGGGSNNLGTIFNYNVSTGNEKVTYDFGNSDDGHGPTGSLIQAINGLLYGMTDSGGIYDKGIIFSYNISDSTETDLHDFGNDTDGTYPFGSLMQANNSMLYGMTFEGGVYNKGIIFSYNISTSKYTDIYDFKYLPDGQSPYGSLIQASDSFLYGMTFGGGAVEGVQFLVSIFLPTKKQIFMILAMILTGVCLMDHSLSQVMVCFME